MFNNRGQTLLELVVAIGVSVLIVGALVFATISSLRNAQFSKNQLQATKLAQEGLEKVRVSRDRNQCIKSLDVNVHSWNGNSTNITCPGTGSIWTYPVTGSNGNCENLTIQDSKCYFKTDTDGLTLIGYSQTTLPPLAEIPSSAQNFKRVITISDTASTYTSQKIVTAIVRWTDFSGIHESKLTTLLRRL